MSKTRKNPYRETSAYGKVFNDIRDAKQKGISKGELASKGHKMDDIAVVISPRAEGNCRGDCRGSLSAQGHLYFLAPKIKDNVKRFVLRWRKEPLEPRKRVVKNKVKQKKEATKETKAEETKAEETTKETVA